jgi:predicted ArsR family transcriptional regulator
MATDADGAHRLDLLKALGDNTRYAIYLELARSSAPLTTSDVAGSLGLHPNTVRPHLERMREVGLLDLDTVGRGGVGRPQHRYTLSAEAPSLGLEPSPWPTMARMLLGAAAQGGLDPQDLHDAGADQGRVDARRRQSAGPINDTTDTVAALLAQQARLGFDPEVATSDAGTTMAFAHCPFRELAESHPELVCTLHCGLVEGFMEVVDGPAVTGFHDLADRTPCRVDLAPTAVSGP